MRTLSYIISSMLFMFTTMTFAQSVEGKISESNNRQKDSIVYKTNYGLRIGVDISKILKQAINKNYKGIEFVGDYRVSKKWYVATEMGYESMISVEDYTKSTSSGKYLRVGANYNTYDNWMDMNNEIYVGGRYGIALFNQKLNNYIPNINNTYFPVSAIDSKLNEDLSAHWLELQLGIKVEVIKNLYIGLQGAYKIGLYIKDPKNFKTIYSPGINYIYAPKNGFGFNYTISYLIPFKTK